jgi:hypothetical protein
MAVGLNAKVREGKRGELSLEDEGVAVVCAGIYRSRLQRSGFLTRRT